MNNRRRIRLYTVIAILTALAVAVALVMYALRANIDLFYTPAEIQFGKGEKAVRPSIGEHLRIGGYVLPGSIQRDDKDLTIRFIIYDARGQVKISYQGILPDLFREGQGVVAQGTLDSLNHIRATQILAKHDEKYTPPEVASAMQLQGMSQKNSSMKTGAP